MKTKIFIDSELKLFFLKKRLPFTYVNYFHDLIEILTGNNKTICFEGIASLKDMRKKNNRSSIATYRIFFSRCFNTKIFTKLEKSKYRSDIYFISIDSDLCKHLIVQKGN